MALLTAEEILNKEFSKTKYREGFDQDEVDDFLDAVADTVSVLSQEVAELRARLAASAQAAPAVAAPAGETPQNMSLLAAATDPAAAPNMLAIAQKLQAEYVAAGEEARDRIVAEGNAQAEEILRRAKAEADEELSKFTAERKRIEERIDDLRRFEKDYRNSLRVHLNNLIEDLEHVSGRDVTAANPVEAVASSAPSAEVSDRHEAVVEPRMAEFPASTPVAAAAIASSSIDEPISENEPPAVTPAVSGGHGLSVHAPEQGTATEPTSFTWPNPAAADEPAGESRPATPAEPAPDSLNQPYVPPVFAPAVPSAAPVAEPEPIAWQPVSAPEAAVSVQPSAPSPFASLGEDLPAGDQHEEPASQQLGATFDSVPSAGGQFQIPSAPAAAPENVSSNSADRASAPWETFSAPEINNPTPWINSANSFPPNSLQHRAPEGEADSNHFFPPVHRNTDGETPASPWSQAPPSA